MLECHNYVPLQANDVCICCEVPDLSVSTMNRKSSPITDISSVTTTQQTLHLPYKEQSAEPVTDRTSSLLQQSHETHKHL